MTNLSVNILKEISKEANENINGDSFEEFATYLYKEANGDIDHIPSYEETNEYFFDCNKAQYKSLYKAVEKAVNNASEHYYNGRIELSDRRTMGNLYGNIDDVDPDESLFAYEKLRDEAFAKFEEETGVEIWQDGRMGRHIVVDDTFYNAYHYDELCAAQEKWEDWVIEEFAKRFPFPEEEVNDETTKGE